MKPIKSIRPIPDELESLKLTKREEVYLMTGSIAAAFILVTIGYYVITSLEGLFI